MIKIDEIIGNIFDWQVFGLIIATGAILLYAYNKKKIDKTAVFSAGAQGSVCLIAFGAKGVWPMLMFFVFGNIVTRIGKAKKEKKNIGQETRDYKNVFANGGAAMIFGLFHIAYPDPIWLIGLWAAMTCALADTSATEIGMAVAIKLKQLPVLFDFRKLRIEEVEIGTAGAVSLGGFLSSLIGSEIMSLPLLFWGYSFTVFLICSFAGFAGAAIDSLLGCTIEREWGNKNTTHWINFTTTFIAGCSAIVLYICLI
ncbi:DUF92 domain-containing protein [Candidatus Parcubacteria bacterium]|nr:DUF92 domain-containing protein [Candidatus Parcubacteria bacterium]